MIEYRERRGGRPHWLAPALLGIVVIVMGLATLATTGPIKASPAGALNQAGATLSVSPTSIGAGGIVTATWSGISNPNSCDYLMLLPVGAPDNQYLAWRLTTGTASGSVGFQLPSSMAPGSYELRLYAGANSARLAVSNPFNVPSLSAAPASVGAGGIVTATWSGISNPTSTDWIALYTPGAADDQYLAWRYTTGAGSGNVPFQLPSTAVAGTYELRLFSNSTGLRLAVSNSFTVVPTLSVSPPSLAPSGILTATWSGIASPTSSDWIGLFPAGVPDSSNERYAWEYTDGSATGSAGFQLPDWIPAGTYELRLFSSGTWLRMAVSNPLTVPSLSVGPSTSAPGATLSVSWDGISGPTSSDWTGFFPVGSADTAAQRYNWEYTNGAAGGTVGYQVPSTDPQGNPLSQGTYELRLFSNGTWLRLAVSNPITIPPPSDPGPGCSPRPPVGIQFDHASGQVTVTAGAMPSPYTNSLTSIQIGAANNARIDVTGQTGSTGNFTFNVPAGTTQMTFHISAINPTGLMVPFTVFDACTQSPWTTFVGTGTDPQALVPTSTATPTPTATATPTSTRTPQSTSTPVPTNVPTATRTPTSVPTSTFTPLPQPPQLTADQPGIGAGGVLTISWTNVQVQSPYNWVGLFQVGDPTNTIYQWRYLFGSDVVTTGPTSGHAGFEFPIHLPLGTYQLRLYSNNTWTQLASTTIPVNISLSEVPTVVLPGQTIRVYWCGLTSPDVTVGSPTRNWFGLFDINQPEMVGPNGGPPLPGGGSIVWNWTTPLYDPVHETPACGSQLLTIPPGLPQGVRQIRLFAQGTRIATNNPQATVDPLPRNAPAYIKSNYIGSAAFNSAVMGRMGCNYFNALNNSRNTNADGYSILQFGAPSAVNPATVVLQDNSGYASYDDVEGRVIDFANGYISCLNNYEETPGQTYRYTAVIVLGVNNSTYCAAYPGYPNCGNQPSPLNPYNDGQEWGTRVSDINARLQAVGIWPYLIAIGGGDFEQVFSAPQPVLDFRNGYLSTASATVNSFLYYGQCEGCQRPAWCRNCPAPTGSPPPALRAPWTYDQIVDLAWRTAQNAPGGLDWPSPQIYNPTTAAQWFNLSIYARTRLGSSGPMHFRGATTEYWAVQYNCSVVNGADCHDTNVPEAGWTQLADALYGGMLNYPDGSARSQNPFGGPNDPLVTRTSPPDPVFSLDFDWTIPP